MCQARVLSSRNSATVSHCIHCRMLLIRHHSLLLNFNPEEFISFRNLLNKLDYQSCCASIDGDMRAVIRTPYPDICFAFTYDEWKDLKEAVDEAIYMQEVYHLMTSDGNYGFSK